MQPTASALRPVFDASGIDRVLAAVLASGDLESLLRRPSAAMRAVGAAVGRALIDAYRHGAGDPGAHLLLQRVLYRINRLQLFWYDDLDAYRHERSPWVLALRERVEAAWQRWEAAQLGVEVQVDVGGAAPREVATALRERAAADLAPARSASGRWIAEEADLSAYRGLLTIASLDALVEASQLSRTLGGVSNPMHATMTRLLVEEYGGGRAGKKHSTYFRTMLEAVGLDATPEAHLDAVPWEVLATINQSFLLSDRKRHFLRYVGGLLYTEVSVPAAFACYRDAAIRLGLPPEARAYWELHIKEDARHGPWMLEQVALPLVARYPAHAAELVFGYDQQRLMSARAGGAVARALGAR